MTKVPAKIRAAPDKKRLTPIDGVMYTADQVREARRAALEEVLKIVPLDVRPRIISMMKRKYWEKP